jgi:hypothetical protein
MNTAHFIANDSLAEGLNAHPHSAEIVQSLLVVLLLPTQFHYQKSLLLRSNRSLQDIEHKVIIPDQPTYYGLVHQAPWEMQNYPLRYGHFLDSHS